MPAPSQKFIHLLLVALLCYGQLVTNIHLVGHLGVDGHSGIDEHANDNHCNSVLTDCSETSRGLLHSISLALQNEGDGHAHGESSPENNPENDCGIYHALSSLNGVFLSFQHELCLPLPSSAATLYSYAQLSGATLLNHHIRAPPALS